METHATRLVWFRVMSKIEIFRFFRKSKNFDVRSNQMLKSIKNLNSMEKYIDLCYQMISRTQGAPDIEVPKKNEIFIFLIFMSCFFM